jgi:hypothetical protein
MMNGTTGFFNALSPQGLQGPAKANRGSNTHVLGFAGLKITATRRVDQALGRERYSPFGIAVGRFQRYLKRANLAELGLFLAHKRAVMNECDR